MESRILSLITQRGGTSFAELQRLDGFKGGLEFGLLEKNILFWSGVSSDAGGALISLRKRGAIVMRIASPLLYLQDGHVPKMPIARQAKSYRQPHWLPVFYWLPEQLVGREKASVQEAAA
jgi:hypothetical protein